MNDLPKKILIIQTAFLGDLILSLPLIKIVKKSLPDVKVDVLCIPFTSEIIKNDPRINEIIKYDKRGKDKGVSGFKRIVNTVRNNNYDAIISPHRSFRSSLISFLSRCKFTVSFDTSAGAYLYKYKVKYLNDVHEIVRDLSLLKPMSDHFNIKFNIEQKVLLPELFTSENDISKIDKILKENVPEQNFKKLVIAPGTIWNTKRYPEEYFAELCKELSDENVKIFLIGSKKDIEISKLIKDTSGNKNVIDLTGSLSITESTELISRCDLLITNDSAPLHIGSSVKTQTFAIFGATVPAFGFFPLGEEDKIFETLGLPCRPCSIHGGDKCPIGTFVCMRNIKPSILSSEIINTLQL